jgi:hypothetical protein
MDRAFGLMLLAENAIRLSPGERNCAGAIELKREPGAEDERVAGILWNFVQTRRGTPPSGR